MTSYSNARPELVPLRFGVHCLRLGVEREELVMPYGATAAIGGRDHAPERPAGFQVE